MTVVASRFDDSDAPTALCERATAVYHCSVCVQTACTACERVGEEIEFGKRERESIRGAVLRVMRARVVDFNAASYHAHYWFVYSCTHGEGVIVRASVLVVFG